MRDDPDETAIALAVHEYYSHPDSAPTWLDLHVEVRRWIMRAGARAARERTAVRASAKGAAR